jgi:thioredoxin reductase/Fe-S-cluster-containing hydrogenase component 2/CRP-like cAMP-binding protein
VSDHFKLAIIGSGPGGLSAAVTAARCGVDHVLLERTPHLSDTIYKYQKGKRVMAHPLRLPLLGEVPFAEGSREEILGGWDKSALDAHVNVRYGAEVTLIQKGPVVFTISIAGGETITADLVILAIGLQGNIRKLAIPGADRDWVQYQLDDPDAYADERIIVVGAGDAGIENAVALSKQNEVSIINVAPDFSRAKPGNVADIEKLVRGKVVRAYHNTKPKRIDDGALVVDTPEGEVLIPCDRILARIGAIAPRKFLEDCGIKLPSKDPGALPELTEDYESNVPGMYIIGALAGYTLIKQAMNQGFELVRRLANQPVEPADEDLLRQRFKSAFPNLAVRDVLTWLREHVPILAGLTTLQLREAMLDSEIVRFNAGQTVFNAGDYTNSLWNVAEGAALVHVAGARADEAFHIEAGEFFGELGLLSGRRRSATVTAAVPSIMVEIPRRVMRRLETSVEAIQRELDRVALRRIVHTTLARHRPIAEVEDIIAASTLKTYKAGEAIVTEGEPIDAMYILRTGSAIVSARDGTRIADIGFVAAGDLFGERGFLGSSDVRAATVRASIASEAVRIDAAGVKAAMGHLPELHDIFAEAVRAQMERSLRRTMRQASHTGMGEVENTATAFLVSHGIGEATNAFFINESLCTRCGNCESACAATHDGVSRVSRDKGTSAVSILLPLACRHCENPHCMTDCPPDAISRQPSGEVVVDQKTCIGCSNCANNCPYGVITMAYPAEEQRGGIGSIFAMVGLPVPKFGHGKHEASHAKKAYKCDLCRGNAAGPACVNACPTGAAIRVDPETYMAYLREDRGSA